MQGDCSFSAFLKEQIKSILFHEPSRALSTDSLPGGSTQIPSLKKVTSNTRLTLPSPILEMKFSLSVSAFSSSRDKL